MRIALHALVSGLTFLATFDRVNASDVDVALDLAGYASVCNFSGSAASKRVGPANPFDLMPDLAPPHWKLPDGKSNSNDFEGFLQIFNPSSIRSYQHLRPHSITGKSSAGYPTDYSTAGDIKQLESTEYAAPSSSIQTGRLAGEVILKEKLSGGTGFGAQNPYVYDQGEIADLVRAFSRSDRCKNEFVQAARGSPLLAAFDPRKGMEGGQPGEPGLAPGLQSDLNSAASVQLVTTFDYQPTGSCAKLSTAVVDECFLPAVGLVYDNGASTGLTTNCSGTIIGGNSIVTAAHCVCEKPVSVTVGTGTLATEGFYTNGSVIGGVRWPSKSANGIATVLYEVIDTEVFNEERWREICAAADAKVLDDEVLTGLEPYDLAIVRTSPAKPFPDGMRAVMRSPPAVNTRVNLAGFGDDPTYAPGIDSRKRYLASRFSGRSGEMLVVSGALGDSCSGDSGSGAMVRLATGRLAVFGTLSSGHRICEPGREARYVDISDLRYRDFLNDHAPDLERSEAETIAEDQQSYCLGLRCPRHASAYSFRKQ